MEMFSNPYIEKKEIFSKPYIEKEDLESIKEWLCSSCFLNKNGNGDFGPIENDLRRKLWTISDALISSEIEFDEKYLLDLEEKFRSANNEQKRKEVRLENLKIFFPNYERLMNIIREFFPKLEKLIKISSKYSWEQNEYKEIIEIRCFLRSNSFSLINTSN